MNALIDEAKEISQLINKKVGLTSVNDPVKPLSHTVCCSFS